jgi:hypothetical protein
MFTLWDTVHNSERPALQPMTYGNTVGLEVQLTSGLITVYYSSGKSGNRGLRTPQIRHCTNGGERATEYINHPRDAKDSLAHILQSVSRRAPT